MHKRFILALLIILMTSSFVFAVQYDRIERIESELKPVLRKALPMSVVLKPPFSSENVEVIKDDNAIAMWNPDGRVSLACVADGWSDAFESRIKIFGKKFNIGELGPDRTLKASVKIEIPYKFGVSTVAKTEPYVTAHISLYIMRYEPSSNRSYAVRLKTSPALIDGTIVSDADYFRYAGPFILDITHTALRGTRIYSFFADPEELRAGTYHALVTVAAIGRYDDPGSGAVISNIKIDEIKLEIADNP